MKKSIFLLMAIVALCAQPVIAANTMASTDTPSEATMISDRQASFPGGKYALRRYISSHMKLNHLKKLKSRFPSATVEMEFTVKADGRVCNLKKLKSPHSGLTDEAARILRGMPKWSPAISGGRAIDSRVRHSFYFNLRDYKYGNYARTASFRGGSRALDSYFQKNLRISHLRSKLGHKISRAEVVLEFDVDSDGTVKNFKKISSSHSGLTEDAVRVARKMPNWYPAYSNGSAIKSRQRYTVKFW